MSAWKAEQIRTARSGNVVMTRGWTYAGIGLVHGQGLSWALIHLNSGHAISAFPSCDLYKAMEVGADIADGGDLGFENPNNYGNMYPDLPEKVRETLRKHFPSSRLAPMSGRQSDETARKISADREDEQYGG